MTFAAVARRTLDRVRAPLFPSPFSLLLLITVLAFRVAPVSAQTSESPVTVSPGVITRGAILAVTVSNAPLNPRVIEIHLNGHVLAAVLQTPVQPGAETFRTTIPATIDPNDKTFLPLGIYQVTVWIDQQPFPSAATVSVIPAAQAPPVLTSISPAVFIPSGAGEELTLTGSGFSESPQSDNVIFLRSHPIAVAWDGCANPEAWTNKQTVHGSVEPGGQSLVLCNIRVPDEASVGVSVHQGALASADVKLVLSPWHTGTIVFLSLLVDLVGAALILFLASTIRKYTIKGEHYGLFRILFLDPETNSYSLSKYQFYAWTAAALFSYTYLVIGRLLVQHLTLPDVPTSLPGIIGIGAGTAVGAQVVTAVRGPKGGGPEKPSLGDFITSGGVAAPERVQIFLWTNLAVLAFCVATLRSAPWEITTLPDIGSGLLFLSGLSSVGYLGGKLARKPGPVLTEISLTPALSELSAASSQSAVAQAGGKPDLTQPIAEAEAMVRSAQVKLSAPAPGAGMASPQALVGAQAALKALRGALAAAQATSQASVPLTTFGDLAADADAGSQLAAAAFAQDLEAAGAQGETPASEASRALAELAQECAAATQAFGSGVSQAVGVEQAQAFTQAQMAAASPEVRTIVLRGRNLSTQATFEINDRDLPFRMLTAVNGVRGPVRVIPEEDRSLDSMGREIRLNMNPGDLEPSDRANYDAWFGANAKALNLMIVNPDGQTAEISFTVPPGEGPSHT